MVKKKRIVRKPIIKPHGAGVRPESPAEDEVESTSKVPELNNDTIKDLEEDLGQSLARLSPSIPEFHTPQEKVISRDSKLSFTKPIIQNGVKIAQVDIEEVSEQTENWNSAVICMILGANLPIAIFEGFIKRVWGHLGIVQIARMSKGLVMVKFHDEATRDEVLEAGVLHFDKKTVIIRPWTTDLNAVKLVRSVPLWIRLHDLGLQYWGNKSLSALVSMVGKPIMVDQHKDCTRVQFAYILVEMEITDSPPRSFQYLNEHGQLLEQRIDYEWLPIKCKNFSGFGHIIADCRKEDMKKKPAANAKLKPGKKHHQPSATGLLTDSKAEPGDIQRDYSHSHGNTEVAVQDKEWHIPKKTIQGKIQRNHGSNTDFQQQVGNAFSALQEQGSREEEEPLLEEQDKQGVVAEFCKIKKVGVGAFLETKLKENKIKEMMDNNFVNWDYYSSPTIEGRLLIVWRKSFVRTYVIAESPQMVHCFIQMAGCEDAFCATFIYGDTCEPSQWLASAHVEPIPHSGSNFTWSNNQDGNSRIYSKIDHALANEYWFDSFPNSKALFSWETISDHCSYTITTTVSNKIGDIIGDIEKSYHAAKDEFLKSKLLAQAHPMELIFLDKEKQAAATFLSQEKIIPDTKAPGADGYSAGSIPMELHSTLISLIPKHQNPTSVVDYRPIAYCTTVYKCISKLLCSRLAKVLPLLINQNQEAFIQGMSIAHNVMILQDLLKNYKRKNVSPRCTIKIDISKAYDTVSWEFMEDLLVAFNIPQKFVKWIMGCLRATSYSLVMNGRVQAKDPKAQLWCLSRVLDMVFNWIGYRGWPVDFAGCILIPQSISPIDPAVGTSLANPCHAIVPYQSEFGASSCLPSPESTMSLPSPPVIQKPRTFQGKAPTISKKASSSSSHTQTVSKRVTHSSSSLKSPSSPVQPSLVPKSNPIGPPRPPSKVSIPSQSRERVQPKRKSLRDTTYQRPVKKSKTKPIPVPSTDSSPKQLPKGSKKIKLPKAPISTVNPSSVQFFVDASKASVYQRWFGSCELWFKKVVMLDYFPDMYDFLKIRKWVHTISKLSAPHPILVREFYANLDRTVIDEGHPGCVSAFVRGNRIPFGPSTIACILKVEFVRNPTYGKQFNPYQTMMGRVLTGRDDYLWDKQKILASHLTPFHRVLHQPSSNTPSTSKMSKGKSPLFKGLSDSSWQVQMFSEFKSFVKRYKKDQKRQLSFDASMYKMVCIIKSIVLQNHYGDPLTPSIDISLHEFHRDSFGASSDGSGSNAHVQGEPSVSVPVSSLVPQDLPPIVDPSLVTTTPNLVSSGPLSQGEFDKEMEQSAHVQ
uniref:Reverse transcriptase domain-containing protein n=1 Tax=Cannabis sativa TaxID=3483 RepID=A0A803PTB7_CANSA